MRNLTTVIASVAKKSIFICLLIFSNLASAANLAINEFYTNNGVRVLFVQTQQVPMLDIAVVFTAGAAYDGAYSGLAKLTNAMLNEGAGNYNVDQLAEQFANVGAVYGNDIGLETSIFTLRTLTEQKKLSSALNTFALILQAPTFPNDSLTRIKGEMQVNLNLLKQAPNYLATRAFMTAVYGTHPYANPVDGTAASIKELSVTDVREFYRKLYVAKNALVVMVGNVSKVQAEAIAKSLVGALPQGKLAPALAKIQPQKATKKNISFPSTQTTVILGGLGIQRSDPSYFPLLVGNYILGGGSLNSLLMTDVREQHGLTYGIGSSFIPLVQSGIFAVTFQSRNNEVKQAIKITDAVLQKYLQEGPSDAELKAAKNYLTGNFPIALSSNTALLQNLIMIGYYHLPLDYLNMYSTHVNKVTAEQIKHAMKKHIQVDNLSTITVGASG